MASYSTAALSSDMQVFKTSTDAIIEEFKNGELYKNDKKLYFDKIMSVCNHFKRNLRNIEDGLNAAYIDPDVDQIYEFSDVLEEYVDFICEDFQDFKKTVTKVIPKDKLPNRAQIEFNAVEQKIIDLHSYVELVINDILSQVVGTLTDEDLEARSM